jgi:uncharacterized protein (DUF2236 family)
MPCGIGSFVSEEDLERQLDLVRAAATSPSAGVFGPQSLMWRIDREAVIFLGAGRALLLQLAHPWVATAIRQHSRIFGDPIGRFHRTFDITFTLVFGTLDQAIAAARRLHRRHAVISGVLPAAAGSFPRGTVYRASDVAALRWVHATLTDTARAVHDLLLPALTDEERERYYAESLLHAAMFGIPRACMPPTWTAFAAYNKAMWQSDTLAVTGTARALAERIFLDARSWQGAPTWYRALTAQMLPPRLRAAFGLSYGDNERRAAERAIAWRRRFYPLLPSRLRYVGPYQEAEARLSGWTRPDLATHVSGAARLTAPPSSPRLWRRRTCRPCPIGFVLALKKELVQLSLDRCRQAIHHRGRTPVQFVELA